MLLDDNKHEEFLSQLYSGNEDTNSLEEESEVQSSASEEANDEIEASSTSPNDHDEIEASSTSEEASAIPYSRFQEVIHSRNEYRDQISSMESKVEELQRQLSSPKATEESYDTAEDDEFAWLEEYDDDEFGSDAMVESDSDGRYSSLEDRLYKFEVAKAQTDLEAEIAGVRSEFPDVPDEIMLHAVVQDPTVNIYEVAAQYNDFVQNISTQAVEKFRSASAPAVPPRPNASGFSTERSEQKSPGSMADAKLAMMRWIKQP